MSQLQFQNSKFVIPASIYFSKLNASVVSGDSGTAGNNDFTIPIEIGGNIYCQYSISSMSLSPYMGLDVERFTTFNMADLENGEPLATRQNNLLYATAGVGHNFSIGAFHIHMKGSLAKSIYSGTTSAKSSDRFSGYRGLIYLNLKRDGPFLVHAFYKHYDLNGPTKLTIDRIGIGVGYFLF